MVAHGGVPTFSYEIIQDRAGVQTPSETRVSMGRADPHGNSGVWKQMQSKAVEHAFIRVQVGDMRVMQRPQCSNHYCSVH